jgi:hypothetical protein
MAYADGFSRDPASNSAPPPLGAPQGGLPVKRISATFRTLMASVAECWQGPVDGAPGVKTLRGMSTQDPGNVAITGGRIGGNVVIEGSSELVFGLTAQQFYDALYNVGEVRWLAVGTAPSIPPAVTASWVQLANGFVVVTATPANAGTTVAGSWDTNDAGAIAAWSGATGGHALTMAELPASLLVNAYGGPSTGLFQAGSNRGIAQDPNAGGGQAHTHPVTVPGASAHHHTVTPPQLFLAAWKRVS